MVGDKSLPFVLLCFVQYIMKILGISIDPFLHNALEGTDRNIEKLVLDPRG